jgi:Phosphotransferase enzyme family
MESEVATMNYVKQHTAIPIPTLYGYDCSYCNPLGCPYLLMEHIKGRPLPDVIDEIGGMTDAQIFKVHAQMANVSLQLAQLCFPTIGHLYWDSTNEFVVGNIVDRKCREFGTFNYASDFYKNRALYVYNEAQQKSVKGTINSGVRELETARLHTLAAPFAVSPEFDKGPFLLQHVDLHRQNVLVDHDWIVVGIIDWSWAGPAPVDSFRPLPFNLAEYVLPRDPANIQRHDQLFWTLLEHLEGPERGAKGFRISDLRGRKSVMIASILDYYSYPGRRMDDVADLLKLLPKEYTHTWNEELGADGDMRE